ncbi:MAG TPA: tetratricopeptide repeat protein [Salinivirgaceae bacterium]|nr:tetratricopeptide repeat protein [Salinivirgaceae bacterium]
MNKINTNICKVVLYSLLFLFSCTSSRKSSKELVHIPDPKFKSYIIDSKIKSLYSDLTKAKDALNTVINADSCHATAHYELAKISLFEKDYETALFHATKSYELNPENTWFTKLYINVLELNNQTKDIPNIYEDLLKKDFSNLETWYEYFSFLDRQEKYKELTQKLIQFEKYFGLSDDIILNRYQTLLKQRKFKDIPKYLNSILSKDPNNRVANLLFANFYFINGKLEKSNEYFKIILKINQNDEQALIGLLSNQIQLGNAKEIMALAKDIISNTAIELNFKLSFIFEVLEKINTPNTKSDYQLEELVHILKLQYPENPDVLNIYGNLLFKKGNNNQALKYFSKAISIDPSNLQSWIFTIYILEQEKNYTRIISVADSALVYFPNQKDLFLFRGFANMQLDNDETSYQDFLFALKLTGALDEDRTQILHFLAEICHKMNKSEETYKYYEEILKSNQNDLVALNNYAYFLSLEKKELNKALEMSAKTIKVEGKNSTYLDTYAYILFELKRYVDALKYIELAILNGGGNNGVILEHYGDILYKNGQTDLAVTTWKEALEKGQDTEILRYKIDNEIYIDQID